MKNPFPRARRVGRAAAIAALLAVAPFVGSKVVAAAETGESDWPCAQRLVPEISVATIWTGPPIDQHLDTWWQNEEVFELVDKLVRLDLDEKDGVAAIDAFAETVDADKSTMLSAIFAGLFQKANAERTHQIAGIKKFFRQQQVLTESISEIGKDMRELRSAGAGADDERMRDLNERLTWTIRVFDERARLTPYVCEEPVLLEQRLGTLARAIEAHLSD